MISLHQSISLASASDASVENQIPMVVSAVALAENAVRDRIANLPVRYFQLILFNIDNAQAAGGSAAVPLSKGSKCSKRNWTSGIEVCDSRERAAIAPRAAFDKTLSDPPWIGVMSVIKAILLLSLGFALSVHAQEAASKPQPTKPEPAKPAPEPAPEPAPLPPALELDAADFPSIQAALDALPESGGILRLGPGTVEIREPLVISTAETRIEGSGASTHIKNLNEEGQPALRIRPKAFDANPKAKIWRVQLGNFRISGNEASGDGVLAENVQEIFIHGLSVDHHGGHGIALIDCYEDPRVSDSILTYNKKAGLFIDAGHDIVVNANHFEENQDALICVDAFNLCMNGNNIDDHLGNGVIIENTYGSVVSGNMIEECNGTAIILDRDCYGITLSSNIIAHDMGGGIDLRDAHGITVSANNFTLVHHFGVRVSEASGRIAISANHFGNSHIGEGLEKRHLEHEKPIQLDIGHGIVLENTRSVTVSANHFSGLDGPAVRATGASDKILINGNVTTDLNRRTPDSKEAFVLSPETKATVSNNLID